MGTGAGPLQVHVHRVELTYIYGSGLTFRVDLNPDFGPLISKIFYIYGVDYIIGVSYIIYKSNLRYDCIRIYTYKYINLHVYIYMIYIYMYVYPCLVFWWVRAGF